MLTIFALLIMKHCGVGVVGQSFITNKTKLEFVKRDKWLIRKFEVCDPRRDEIQLVTQIKSYHPCAQVEPSNGKKQLHHFTSSDSNYNKKKIR
jgi:hypothetical protein